VDFYRDVPSFQVQTQAGTIDVSMEFLHKELEKVPEGCSQFQATIISQLADRIKAMRTEADSFEQARDGDSATLRAPQPHLSAREFGRCAADRTRTTWDAQQLATGKNWTNFFPTRPRP